MTRSVALLAVLAVCAAVAAEETLPAPEEPPPPAPVPQGDVIHFRSGGTLSGVQVLRERLDVYEVEVHEGVDPIIVPRAHVERIEYDDIDPIRLRRLRASRRREQALGVVEGQEIAAELFERLTATLPEEPLSYADTDFTEILTDLGDRFEVAIEFSEAVREIPEERRRVSFETEPGAALVSAVRALLLQHFPAFDIAYAYDVVQIVPRDDAAAPAPEAPDPTQNETAGPEAGGETDL